MSAQVIDNKKYQIVKNLFDDFQEMMKKNSFDLLQDENLKSHIQNCCEKFKLKMEIKITIGAIFDSRFHNSSLIDVLVNEDITKRLTNNCPYLVKGTNTSDKLEITTDLQQVKTISVPTTRWNVLENSFLVLSGNNEENYKKEMKDMLIYDPDVVVLVINSPKDLEKSHIQSFLSKTGQKFNYGNFFLVLKNAKDLDCAAVNICDVCYPDNIRKFLTKTGIEFENKSYKISSSESIESQHETYLRENCDNLKISLEKQLNIETVLDNFYNAAKQIGRSMKEIKKSFDEEKERKSIGQINSKLNEYTPIVNKTIDNYERDTNHAALQTLNSNYQNNAILGEFMEEFMKDKVTELKKEIRENIKMLMENDKNKEHKKYINIVNDMFFNQNLNEEEVWEAVNNYLNIDVMKCKLGEVKASEELKSPTKSLWQRFVNGTEDVVAKICSKAKDAYDGLVKTFKEKMDNILEVLKNTMDHAINLSRNEFLPIFLDKCKFLKEIPFDEEKRMLNNLDQLINETKTIINKKDKVDIYNHNIGYYIPNEIYKPTKFNVSSVDHIYSKMKSFGYNKYTTDLSNEFTDIFRDKYSISDLNRNFDNSCRREFSRFQELINEQKFYDLESEKIMHKVSVAGAAVSGGVAGGILGGGIFSLFTAPIGAVTAAVIAATMDDKVEHINRKYIKMRLMLDEVAKLKANLQALIHKTIMEMNGSILKYLEFMSNMQNIQN